MHTPLRTLFAAFLLAAATTVATGAPAHAAGWSVSPGGWVTFGPAPVTLTGVSCSLSGRGYVCGGTDLPSAGLIESITFTFSGCSSSTVPLTVTHAGTGAFTGTSISAGEVNGWLTTLVFRLSGPGCAYTVSGSAAARYGNGTGRMTVAESGSMLRISAVSGCFGLVRNGDPAPMSSHLPVAPPLTFGHTP
ncbi:MAG TPA: hypothetical protein VGD67_25855 [Pseudonocardiaceae bacterium]